MSDIEERRPIGRLTITITYHAPLVGQRTSKVTVESAGRIGAQRTEHRNTWTVWGDDEATKPGTRLADGVLEEATEAIRDWSHDAEVAQCKVWRHELGQKLLAEIAATPDGPRVGFLREIMAELDSREASIVRAPRMPACGRAVTKHSVKDVEDAAWDVLRHAHKTGDIPEQAAIVEDLMNAVVEDMKAASLREQARRTEVDRG